MSHQRAQSCFATKLSHFIDLSSDEREVVADFERAEQGIAAHDCVYEEGQSADKLFLVKQGWMCLYRMSDDGQRHILQLRHPGDISGMLELMLTHRCSSLLAIEPCIVCPLPKSALRQLSHDAPRVAFLIHAMATLDQVILTDALQTMSSASAIDRVLHWLLAICFRLQMTNPDMGTRFRMPLNQSAIGEMLGLTNVTVSKVMSGLEKRGHIRRENGYVNLIDIDASVERVSFRNRYEEADRELLSLTGH